MLNTTDFAPTPADHNQSATVENTEAHPIWTLTVPEPAEEVDAITSDELVDGWSLIQMYGQQTETEACPATSLPKRTLPERLAALLIELSLIGGKDGVIEDSSFQEMATALGTYRETVASILRAFRRQGMIDVGRKQIHILDYEMLAEIGDVSLL